LFIYETDTDLVWRYDGAGWQRVGTRSLGGGVATGTTNASGALTVTHSLGWTPTVVTVTPSLPNGASSNDRFVGCNVGNLTSTTFDITRSTHQDGSICASKSITVYWMAMR
jgi:hypothetical protein